MPRGNRLRLLVLPIAEADYEEDDNNRYPNDELIPVGSDILDGVPYFLAEAIFLELLAGDSSHKFGI